MMATFSILFLIFLQCFVYITCDTTVPSVIIVGAGSAGIAAASRLLENNITNIKILEAEDRIGGRIHSVKFGESFVDLGAQWCHGEGDNTVYQLVKDLDLLEPSYWPQTFYHSSPKHIDEDFVKELYELFGRIYKGEKQNSEGISIGDYITTRYNKSINEQYGNDPEKLKFASEFLHFLKKDILFVEGTFSWFDTPAADNFDNSDGNQNLNWKGRGYKTILDVLMKNYPNPEKKLPIDDKIFLNKEVVKIAWDQNNENGVSVECLDKSVYNADHLIFTASVGALKDSYSTLFVPPLPHEKIDAIQELQIGAVVKAFFHFPQRWWPTDNFKSISLVWSEEDASQFSNDSEKGYEPWLLDLAEFLPVEKNPNVLEVWFAGQFVPEIELLPDDKIIDGAMFILNKFLGDQFHNITKPDAIVHSKWYTNPHFRGIYSRQTLNSYKREVSEEIVLSKPLIASNGKQTLLFAGEATSPNHFATVHGAIETGFREADRIIGFYK